MTDTPNTDVLAARAREVLESVEWQMANHLPAKGEMGKQCYERRLVETIAEALGEATPQSDGTAIPAGEVEKLNRIRTSMALLQQNSEGCAVNHYGGDHQLFGMPGWLIDTRADLDAFTAMLATAPKVASDTMREALSWAIAEIEGRTRYTPDYYTGKEEREDALAKAKAALTNAAALSVQSPANAGQDGDLLEQAARVADVEAIAAAQNCEIGYRPAHNNGVREVSERIASAIRALNPTKDAQS